MKILSAVLLAAGIIFAQTPYEQGIKYLDQCKKHEASGPALIQTLDQALAEFQKALNDPAQEEKAAVAILDATYLKGSYTSVTREEKKKMFADARDLGERLIKKYPQSGPLHYYLAVSWGRWGEEFGKMAAARQGAAEKIRDNCEASARLGPAEITARSYRVLGRLHHQAPRIPFLLGWPSNKKAIEYLRKSDELQPHSPGTIWYLAEVLADEGHKDEAKRILEKVIRENQGPDYQLETDSFLADCKKLREKLNR
jgi:tetratricopeptide (TPR) repeat protein